MRKRVLMVVAMCVLSLGIGVIKRGPDWRAAVSGHHTIAAAEKSDDKGKGPGMEASGKTVLADKKYD